jgi:chemotaxis protein CheC
MNFNDNQIDALTEIINIGVGRAAGSLSDLIGERIELTVPAVQVGRVEEMSSYFTAIDQGIEAAVIQDFRGGLQGRAVLAFPHESGVKLGQLILKLDANDAELSEDISGVLEEMGNIVLNGVVGSISNLAAMELSYSVPKLSVGQRIEKIITAEMSKHPGVEHYLVMADTRFYVAKRNIDGSLLLVLDASVIQTMLTAVLGQYA